MDDCAVSWAGTCGNDHYRCSNRANPFVPVTQSLSSVTPSDPRARACPGHGEPRPCPAQRRVNRHRKIDPLLPHLPMYQRKGSGRGGVPVSATVTSTYFEDEAEANQLAQRGYSRDHRLDCSKYSSLSL
jgi:hypothetical protein